MHPDRNAQVAPFGVVAQLVGEVAADTSRGEHGNGLGEGGSAAVKALVSSQQHEGFVRRPPTHQERLQRLGHTLVVTLPEQGLVLKARHVLSPNVLGHGGDAREGVRHAG